MKFYCKRKKLVSFQDVKKNMLVNKKGKLQKYL